MDNMAGRPEILEPERCKQIGRSCACYNLRKAARAVTRLYEDYLRPSGLKATQYTVLMAAHAKGPIALTKLAHMTVTERTTLTRNLNVLEKKGFLKITAGADRRERLIAITDDGRRVLTRAVPLWEEAQANIEKGLGRDRMEGFLADLLDVTTLARK